MRTASLFAAIRSCLGATEQLASEHPNDGEPAGWGAMRTKAILAVGLGCVVLGGAGAFALIPDRASRPESVAVSTPKPVWSEAPWPFPIDEWGQGKAFACTAADCGVETDLYIRAKIGFCNCATGVSDDE